MANPAAHDWLCPFMLHAVAIPRRRLSWTALWPWLLLLAIDALVIATGAVALIRWPHDWGVFEQIPQRLIDGSLYVHEPGYNFVWSPAVAWVIAIGVLPLGFYAWFVLHAVSLALLRDRRLIALAVCSLSLWIDAGIGNTVAFAFVTGVLALRGSRVGELAFLALFVLIPRPVTLPLALWLLWREPRTRLPFAAMVAAVALTTLGSGYALDWLGAVASLTSEHASGDANAGPTRLLGMWWMFVGVPLAIWLAAHRRLGLAGLAITPYLFPQYLLLALWDVVEYRSFARDQRVVDDHHAQQAPKGIRSRVAHWSEPAIPRVGIPVYEASRSGLWATAGEQDGDLVSMDLAPAGILGGPVDEGGPGWQEDRIGAV